MSFHTNWGISVLFCIAALTACSSGSDAPPSSPSQTPAAKKPASEIYLSDPFKPVPVSFSQALDSASVADAKIVIKQEGLSQAVEFTTEYDPATKILYLTPEKPLWFNEKYAVTLSGLRTTNGGLVDRREVTVNTTSIPLNRKTDNQSGPYTQSEFLRADRTVRTIFYSAPGPDGVWRTVDDVIAQYSTTHYVPKPRVPNGNAISYATSSNLGNSDQKIFVSGPGSDGQWFTGDDTISGYIVSSYDYQGRLLVKTYANGSGVDSRWRTQDDDAVSYVQYLYSANGNRVRETGRNTR